LEKRETLAAELAEILSENPSDQVVHSVLIRIEIGVDLADSPITERVHSHRLTTRGYSLGELVGDGTIERHEGYVLGSSALLQLTPDSSLLRTGLDPNREPAKLAETLHQGSRFARSRQSLDHDVVGGRRLLQGRQSGTHIGTKRRLLHGRIL
jgi:hypothetical protein